MKTDQAKKILENVFKKIPVGRRPVAIQVFKMRILEEKTPDEIIKELKINEALYTDIMKQFKTIGKNNFPCDFMEG